MFPNLLSYHRRYEAQTEVQPFLLYMTMRNLETEQNGYKSGCGVKNFTMALASTALQKETKLIVLLSSFSIKFIYLFIIDFFFIKKMIIRYSINVYKTVTR